MLMARSDPTADASLPDILAWSRPGTAIAAMMPMMATTISSSIRVNPCASFRIFIARCSLSEATSADAGQQLRPIVLRRQNLDLFDVRFAIKAGGLPDYVSLLIRSKIGKYIAMRIPA